MFSCFKKPRKPRARKFHSMHGRAKADKAGPQRQVSLQEKLEENVTIETASGDDSSTINQVNEVDHPVVVRSKSPSKSLSRDSGGKASPVDGNNPIENGNSGALTTKNLAEPVEPVTQSQANTNSSTVKGTNSLTYINSRHLNNQATYPCSPYNTQVYIIHKIIGLEFV